MQLKPLAAGALVLATLLSALPAAAQNIAIVNGKPVPKARMETLLLQATRGGQAVTPEMEKQARDQLVLREIFAQEAEKRGIGGSREFRAQMELARQSLLIRELFEDHKRKNPITDAAAKAEYDKFKAQASGTEYRARHILVEQEAEAKALIAQIKGGASFEELAKKHSKDPGSGANGGDLDFAKPDSYVPEFGQAMVRLQKGQMTDAPVRSQFGWHIIRLEDTREAPFPAFADVKDQVKQRLEQLQAQAFQEELRKRAKTDYKFDN
ncbi:MAG: peptidylprolyl isomerase [Betaproteobacteria bacterium]|jgi:peptidyl-prolyl cis-trans isomerase C|nr:peptidylprolyl isomerase [Burkholderiaceae bacterium]MCZ8110484.1 peptidylprolyl isomerase [Rubrivivax sp.]MCZ8174404.1 peptidylprolyl isomerase [Burkholderiaceae bacterium]